MANPSAVRNLGDEARAEQAPLIDLQMSPLGLAAMDALAPAHGQTVLDVGCGAGETLVQLAERVGETGRVVGVDVGPRVLEIARSKTAHLPHVTVLRDDAANLALPEDSFDGIYSRFGIMFFADPVAAFLNLRRMLRCQGRIGFVCWRSIEENELDAFPVQAAGLSIGSETAPFSFQKADTIHGLLRSAGFHQIDIDAHDAAVSSGGIDEMLTVITRVGALGMVLRETPALLPHVEPRVRAALAAREVEGKVSLGTATWIVTAVAS
jgi:SAM-dependent methyltransferase